MRALGPGSVSSFLKVVVEVVHAALWTLLALQFVAGALILLAAPFGFGMLRISPFVIHITGVPRFSGETPAVALMLGFSVLYVAGLLAVFAQMRRVLATLIQGDPFHPANVARLRLMGLALVGLEAIGYLVVFVLAEVCREGARLRREAELTI